ncbi:BREX-1 system adenine-specific DNA-methyltransferase PglX [Lactobacillus helveticus]|uniref:site-specific DNA-methyltransferase (adenine-specific) n=1 Tax=Lactobacillus helveticus TaxID=1587 RepID=A0A3S8SA34_LACHE|nr:BREX-1 system adenine-specific DNA-methyltransferase PglX [Lactobacillus helveticus]AFR22050.1 putative Type II restriction enzyme, methylase subunits [Lactobacillus helveticus R0052]AZK90676.1 N-6 DNA Methylase [Lactobacillus helveticus]MCJ2189778.1 BREX-1 system adenine-specific DNA-methyltransferase PglX [Lactobacillus helveticus]MED7627692.1 BREX-1 system adenine-specific DNA-methyltransferase PglX [Lactobacillus helveticus]MZR05217.1 BREX-1 system adenine-specific DNA-methyltransferase
MDKNKIKKYAINARTELINAIKVKLATLGIDENEIQDKLSISTPDKEYYVDDNEANALTGAQIGWRKDIVAELNRHGYQEDSKTAYKDFVEEVAYTWFNRIIAIRFMEVNNYLPSRVRVLSSEEGRNEPDIINEAMEIGDDLGGYSIEEKELITTALTEKTPELMDSLYTMLFIKQSDALSEILPGLFEETSNYLKLLFTPHYDRGVIKELVNEIPEEYFDVKREGQVQIIGWLYQYYNSAPHEEVVNMNGKAIQKDEIPAATQLFTPDWIVRYMVDNSLGKYYLERHPDSAVRQELKYLLPDEIKAINENQDIIDYKLLDNAMGSGHILVYAFDLFMKMYIEQGYSKRDAAQKIIENNLFGLEIDKRAFQLAYFSIMMKGREYDRRFLRRSPTTNLYYFEDLHVSDEFYNFISDKVVRGNLKKVVKDFSDATELGSIIKIDESIDLDSIEEVVAGLDFESGLDVFGYKKIQKQILKTLKIIKVMTTKYEAVVTNPPYMNKFDKTLKKYLRDNYKNYSKDLFSVFIYHNVHQLVKGGYAGYMTPLVWMFIKTYEPLRHDIINNFKIDSLIQMEYSAFEEATVPIDTFVLKNSDDKIGTYLRLSNFKGGMIVQEQKVLEVISDPTVKYLYHTDQSNFDKIPGSPIAYWASENLINDFEKGTSLGEVVQAKVGLQTGDNKRFLRQWFEVGIDNISFNSHSIKDSVESGKKWFPYNKGGSYRKWYGNYDYVVNWQNDGYEIRHFAWPNGKQRSVVRNSQVYFKEAVTWSDITSGSFAMRFRKNGSIHDVTGMSIFSLQKDKLYIVLGIMNSKIGQYILKILNPTIHTQIGNIVNIPILLDVDHNTTFILQSNLNISKTDWDAFETSWDFQKSPFLTQNAASLHQAYNSWSDEALTRFNQLKSNEEELNRIFINLYGLQDELTPEEDDKEVSVRKADQVRDIKAFLSYFIGCVFGRYSLDQDGLVYAGGDWDDSKYTTFKPNSENIILLTDRQSFDDDRDIIVRLKEFLTKTFDPETLTENMDFIAQTLEPKKFERGTSAEDIIRTYFLNDFYKDHAKIYQKRPIYWEFNSGRNKGFKALMYLQRYNTEQLPMVRHYLHELQPAMNDLIEVDQNLLDQETTASAKSKYRKAIATLNKQMNEIMKYDQILDHLSQDPIDLDLDDGVLVNHDKLQQGEKLLSKL